MAWWNLKMACLKPRTPEKKLKWHPCWKLLGVINLYNVTICNCKKNFATENLKPKTKVKVPSAEVTLNN